MCKWATDLLEQARRQSIAQQQRLEYSAIHEDATLDEGRWTIHIFDGEANIRRIEEAAERCLQRARKQPRQKVRQSQTITQLSFF